MKCAGVLEHASVVQVVRLFTHPSSSDNDRMGFCLCMCVRGKLILPVSLPVICVYVCVEALYVGTCVLACQSVSGHVYVHMCSHVCVLRTTVRFIPSFTGVAVCGPLCVMPMRTSLYVIEAAS